MSLPSNSMDPTLVLIFIINLMKKNPFSLELSANNSMALKGD